MQESGHAGRAVGATGTGLGLVRRVMLAPRLSRRGKLPRPTDDRARGTSAIADLPRGTVAFLFTDIEGSTRLWERDASAMGRALARHNALLDEPITAHGGVHFKTIGDAYQVAFPDVSSAVAAAVDAQRALAAEPWPETGPIRVRMAIHVGEATPVGGDRPDYQSPALNRLASLLGAGHGG